jgi:hypothetical protein
MLEMARTEIELANTLISSYRLKDERCSLVASEFGVAINIERLGILEHRLVGSYPVVTFIPYQSDAFTDGDESRSLIDAFRQLSEQIVTQLAPKWLAERTLGLYEDDGDDEWNDEEEDEEEEEDNQDDGDDDDELGFLIDGELLDILKTSSSGLAVPEEGGLLNSKSSLVHVLEFDGKEVVFKGNSNMIWDPVEEAIALAQAARELRSLHPKFDFVLPIVATSGGMLLPKVEGEKGEKAYFSTVQHNLGRGGYMAISGDPISTPEGTRVIDFVELDYVESLPSSGYGRGAYRAIASKIA